MGTPRGYSRHKDLSGMKFDHWTVLEYAGVNKYNKAMWKCKCDCGTVKNVRASDLLHGYSKSCGCVNQLDLIGYRVGRLTVVERLGSNHGDVSWLCKCDCGNTKILITEQITSGAVKSCGCLHLERITKHGKHNTRLYRIYNNMIARCYRVKNKDYHNYGGRGIKICEEWYDPSDRGKGFIVFYNWAMANGYADNLSIDRENPDGDYCPDNCRWTDVKTQANNTRRTHKVYDGEEYLSYAEFEHKYDLHPGLIGKYISRGYTYDQIIHYAKYNEWIKKDKDGIWRDKDGNQRLLRHYEQDKENKRNKLYGGPINEQEN